MSCFVNDTQKETRKEENIMTTQNNTATISATSTTVKHKVGDKIQLAPRTTTPRKDNSERKVSDTYKVNVPNLLNLALMLHVASEKNSKVGGKNAFFMRNVTFVAENISINPTTGMFKTKVGYYDQRSGEDRAHFIQTEGDMLIGKGYRVYTEEWAVIIENSEKNTTTQIVFDVVNTPLEVVHMHNSGLYPNQTGKFERSKNHKGDEQWVLNVIIAPNT